jgi:hypothetical protein
MKLTRDSSIISVKSLILNDAFLKHHYISIYEMIKLDLAKSKDVQNLKVLEIGGAGGISEIVFPNIFKSDIRFSGDLQLICSATDLPFKSQILDALILKDSFHHLPDINKFFAAAINSMHSGSSIYIADPNWNFISQFIYKYIHPEVFDKKSRKWETDPSQAWASNQALLWIVFKRDQKIFSSSYPNLRFEEIGFSSGLTYVLSGGVFSRNCINSKILIFIDNLEKRYSWILKHTSLTKIIKIIKL